MVAAAAACTNGTPGDLGPADASGGSVATNTRRITLMANGSNAGEFLPATPVKVLVPLQLVSVSGGAKGQRAELQLTKPGEQVASTTCQYEAGADGALRFKDCGSVTPGAIVEAARVRLRVDDTSAGAQAASVRVSLEDVSASCPLESDSLPDTTCNPLPADGARPERVARTATTCLGASVSRESWVGADGDVHLHDEIRLGGSPASQLTLTVHKSGGYHGEVAYAAPFVAGTLDAIVDSTDGEHLTGSVNGHPLTPVAKTQLLAGAPLTLADGTPLPAFDAHAEQLMAALQVLGKGSPSSCAPRTGAMTTKGQPGVMRLGTNSDFSTCSPCLSDCETTLATCSLLVPGVCVGLAYIPFVGQVLFVACVLGLEYACQRHFDNCFNSCYKPGGGCCPVDCGGKSSCCERSETCLDARSDLCCPPGLQTCYGGGQESCIDPVWETCINGAGCPNAPVNQACGQICCPSGQACADTAKSQCCPVERMLATSCCAEGKIANKQAQTCAPPPDCPQGTTAQPDSVTGAQVCCGYIQKCVQQRCDPSGACFCLQQVAVQAAACNGACCTDPSSPYCNTDHGTCGASGGIQ